jgi:hypothetical protein
LRLRFLILLLIACAFAFPAMAQDDPMSEYSATEKAGFAFYNIIRQPPPFTRWVEIRPDYITSKPKVRLAMMDAERDRLKRGFATYIPDRDLITIRTRVHVQRKAVEPGAARTAISLSFPDSDDILYFPFQLGDVWIALTPSGLDAQSDYALTPAENESLPKSGDMTAELTLTPVRVDEREPIIIGGTPLWLMLTNVRQLSLLDNENQPVWTASQFPERGQ